MFKALPFAVLALTASLSPAAAAGMNLAMVGEIFCIGRLSGDMAPVLAILSPELSALVATADDPAALPWQSKPDYANMCNFVGASGSTDRPEGVIAYQYRDPALSGFADKLVFTLIDENLRIDDIIYTDGTTLRAKLAP